MNETITVNGIDYIRANSSIGTAIVIAQRGWVFVGKLREDGDFQVLDNASVIRTWGTTKGIGEIALKGPTSSTKLDPCGSVRIRKGVEIAIIPCEESKWITK